MLLSASRWIAGSDRRVDSPGRTALARVGQREHFTGENDLVFSGSAGGHLDSKEVRAEYKAALARAKLRNLRFHASDHRGTGAGEATVAVRAA